VQSEPRGTAGAGDPPARPRPAASRPSHRPPWLLVLSSLTLFYGGVLLISGLSMLRDPLAAARVRASAEALPPAMEEFSKKLGELALSVVARHQGALRAGAVASIVAALGLLYGAAAVLSRDRHGRTAILTAAWLGIAYQAVSLVVVVPLAQDYVSSSAPYIIEQARASKEPRVAAGPEAVVKQVRFAVVGIPVLLALAGMGGSAVLIRYFGGRRGRRLYGLEPVRGAP
jgi:hypothetical protein